MLTLYAQSWGYKSIRLGSMHSFKLAILIELGQFLRAADIWKFSTLEKCYLAYQNAYPKMESKTRWRINILEHY